MTDTNNGRLKMITNTLTLSQNVAGESAEAVNGVQMDNRRWWWLDDANPNSCVFITPTPLHEQATTTTTRSLICRNIQVHTVLQKLFIYVLRVRAKT